MRNLTNNFSNLYQPVKSLLIYTKQSEEEQETRSVYVESYDIGKLGNPINAHPLTVKEMLELSSIFQSAQEFKTGFLRCQGVIPNKVLFVNPEQDGFALWFTPPQEVSLYFSTALGIPSGKGKVPAMVWKANKETLWVYALKGHRKPVANTVLHYAPFFNVAEDGKVCMGNVRININKETRLESFMHQWEKYFWNSYFSHLMGQHNPVSENIVQLWKKQVSTDRIFPCQVLKSNQRTLKNIFL